MDVLDRGNAKSIQGNCEPQSAPPSAGRMQLFAWIAVGVAVQLLLAAYAFRRALRSNAGSWRRSFVLASIAIWLLTFAAVLSSRAEGLDNKKT